MLRLSAYLILAIYPLSLLADTPEDPLIGLEEDILADMPIVLSATRLAQPLNESPVAMTIIDRQMIEASTARNIPELLRLVPGFQVGYFDGNSPVATYHGHSDFNSKRVQVLIDGRSVYVPSLAGIPWQDMAITLDDIDRIEISRGPNASTYGNNSLFAVVSIYTKLAIEDDGHKVTLISGSKDTIDAYYRFGDQSGALDYRVTVGTNNNDGTDFLNDYTEADFLSYRLDYQIDNDSRLSYQGGYKNLELGDHEPPPDHEIDIAYAYQWLKWEHQVSGKHSLSLQYYYNFHDHKETIDTITVPSFPSALLGAPGFTIDGFSLDTTLNIKSERHDLEFSHQYNSENFRLVSGLSGRLDIVTANEVFDDDGAQYDDLYRAFSHGEYTLDEQWFLNAGITIENNDISGSDVSPRVALIHKLNPQHTFRISASQATRTPVLWEENANYRLSQQLTQNDGNPLDPAIVTALGDTNILTNQFVISSGNLESEEITSLELGYIAQLLDNRLVLDLKVFKDKTDQLIADIEDVFAPDDNFDTIPIIGGEPSPIADDFQNGLKTESRGLELSLDYHHSKDLRLYGYYAYIEIEAQSFNPQTNPADIRRLEVSAPSNSYGIMVIKNWPHQLMTSLSFFHVDDMDWLDRTGSTAPFYQDRSAQAYDKLDVKISKSYRYGKDKLNLALSIQNLIEDFYDYNKTRYTDESLTTVFPNTGINAHGSLQDLRTYLEISYLFN